MRRFFKSSKTEPQPEPPGELLEPRWVSENPGSLADLSELDLPPGTFLMPDADDAPEGFDSPLLWVSDAEVGADLWMGLADSHRTTGLWPVILEPQKGGIDFVVPQLDEGATDLEAWLASMYPDEYGDELAPVGPTFPGLAPASSGTPDWETIPRVVRSRAPFALGLVPAERPADVPAAIGWTGGANYDLDIHATSRLLRSWEERFAAILVGIGAETILLAMGRPPTGWTTRLLAAELACFCPDSIQGGTIEGNATYMDGRETMELWWD
jgi:hypothetical protein